MPIARYAVPTKMTLRTNRLRTCMEALIMNFVQVVGAVWTGGEPFRAMTFFNCDTREWVPRSSDGWLALFPFWFPLRLSELLVPHSRAVFAFGRVARPNYARLSQSRSR